MKLEVGEFYLSASGEVIEIIYKEDNMFEDVYLKSFFEDGICNGDIRDFDLIAHIPKELHFDIIKTIKAYHSNNIIKECIDNIYNNKD